MSDPVFELEDDTDPTLALEGAPEAEAADADLPEGGDAPDLGSDDGAPEPQQTGRGDNSRNLTLAIQKERERRKAAEAQASQYREQQIRLEERLNAFTAQRRAEAERQAAEAAAQQRAQQVQDADPEPNPVEDPDGHKDWQIRELGRRQAAMQAQMEQRQAYEAQQQQERVVRERWQRLEYDVNSFEASFKAEVPDYRNALEFVIANRFNKWRAARPGITDDQVWQILNQERMQLLDTCVDGIRPDGQPNWVRNPSEALYSIAVTEGYTPGGQPAQAQQTAPQAQQQPVPQQRQPSPRFQNMQAGVMAAQRQAPGGRPADAGGRMTIEKLIAMSESEFAAFQEANPGLVQELMS